jgi:predicted Rossmann-fold nucleotide-binding protein
LETSIVIPDFVDARIGPRGSLENLSQQEIEKLLDSRAGGLYQLFRKCALAVLNSGSETDNAKEIFDRYKDFEVELVRQAWGVKLEIKNAPGQAFVDGEMIRGMKEHVFAVLRDVIFINNEIIESGRFDLQNPAAITNAVFHILRNARILDYKAKPNLVVCWGGHSINTEEYQYTKKVGYELGLRGMDVCTGCGPGAMKGPMKGATIGHAKQRIINGRYIGLTEPGIIAAEPPNPIVNQLVIMPDIEKRLEAFVRLSHGVVVFPGGVGTAEEILYCWASCSNRRMRACRSRWSSRAPGTPPTTSCRSRLSSKGRWARRPPTCCTSSSTIRPRSPATWSRPWSRCAISAATTAIPTTTTGC